MSAITTRSLGKKDRYDRQSVRIDGIDYVGKAGILEITLTSLVSVGTGGGEPLLQVPNFNPANDDVIYNTSIVAAATVTLTNKIYVSVNSGVPGPSARVNQDGTWDLLDLTYTLDEENTFTGLTLALNYSVAFTDLTPSTTNPTMGNASLTLNIGDGQTHDTAEIGVLNGTISTSSGYIKAWINQITSTIVNDGTIIPSATFTVNMPGGGCGCCGSSQALISHPLAPVTGTKIYSQGMVIFAVNVGKIDGNGTVGKGTNGQSVALECELNSETDKLSLSVSYNVAFQSM